MLCSWPSCCLGQMILIGSLYLASITRLRYEFNDDIDQIRIVDMFPENHRYLHFEDSVQGVLNLSAHHEPVLEYIGLMVAAARSFNVLPESVLLGGLGSCSLVHALDHWWHRHARIQTVEYSQRIHELARRYFRLRSRNEVIIGDFRSCLEEDMFEVSDLILVDCYSALSIPPHLTTLQFMELLYESLSEKGACIFNLWSPDCNELCGDQLRTMLEVFQRVAVVQCRDDQNFVAMVRKNPRAEWPGYLQWKAKRYDVRILSLDDRIYWPQYLHGSEIITDENMGQFFEAVSMPL